MPHHNRRHFFNQAYFDQIDTEEKAYWLGFLYADGANCDKAANVSMGLAECDAYMLGHFQRAIGSDHKIYIKRSSGYAGTPIHCLIVCSRYLCDSLSKQGCTPRKSLTLQFPTEEQVPKHLARHFIRGYFDGDGSISTGYKQNKKTATAYVSVISSHKFCESIKEIVNKDVPIGGVIKTHRCASGREVFYYVLNGGNQVIAFMDWLYKDATISLDRKREKYRQFLIARNETMPLRFKNIFIPHVVDNWPLLNQSVAA